jgi:hypothetical protein
VHIDMPKRLQLCNARRFKLKNDKTMKSKHMITTVMSLGLAGGVFSSALAQTDNTPGKPSPSVEAKINQAVKAVYPAAVIAKMSKSQDNQFSYYSVTLTASGKNVDAEVTSDGTIVKTTSAGDVRTFPAAAAAAITKTAAGAKITSASLTTTYAKVVVGDSAGDTQVMRVEKLPQPAAAYVVAVENGGKVGKFSVAADGTLVKALAWKLAPSAAGKAE